MIAFLNCTHFDRLICMLSASITQKESQLRIFFLLKWYLWNFLCGCNYKGINRNGLFSHSRNYYCGMSKSYLIETNFCDKNALWRRSGAITAIETASKCVGNSSIGICIFFFDEIRENVKKWFIEFVIFFYVQFLAISKLCNAMRWSKIFHYNFLKWWTPIKTLHVFIWKSYSVSHRQKIGLLV